MPYPDNSNQTKPAKPFRTSPRRTWPCRATSNRTCQAITLTNPTCLAVTHQTAPALPTQNPPHLIMLEPNTPQHTCLALPSPKKTQRDGSYQNQPDLPCRALLYQTYPGLASHRSKPCPKLSCRNMTCPALAAKPNLAQPNQYQAVS